MFILICGDFHILLMIMYLGFISFSIQLVRERMERRQWEKEEARKEMWKKQRFKVSQPLPVVATIR